MAGASRPRMKKALAWTALAVGATVGAVFAYRWVQQARAGISRGLEQAERVTEATRQTLAETQQALRQARQVIS